MLSHCCAHDATVFMTSISNCFGRVLQLVVLSMALIDNQAVFKDLLLSGHVDFAHVDALIAESVDSVSKFANLTGLKPGTREADDLFVSELKRITNKELSTAHIVNFRKAWIESSVLWIAHLKARAEDPSESVAKKVALPEREARRHDQEVRLK
eukprot:6484191-Amphidinium_carterae.1